MSNEISVEFKIRKHLDHLGVVGFGWTKLNRPLSMELYSSWIKDNQHLDMEYLKNHKEQKENPKKYHKAISAIALTISYNPHPWPKRNMKNQIALYAQANDYHLEIPKLLEPILFKLRSEFPNESFEVFTDSAPVLERDLAYRAGLGWIGKNTCLINKKAGSLFFLAEIYTTLSLENSSPWSSDFCGTCNRCIEACPTEALTNDRKLLPKRCISYWTIEAKTIPPIELRKSIGDWLFGCDICQTVCPWNKKHLIEKIQLTKPSEESRIAELKWILSTSRKSLARELSSSPLARVAGWKLQRNAIIVATNNGFKELIPFIQSLSQDNKLSELVSWSIQQFESLI